MALKIENKKLLSVTRTANATLTANRLVKADADAANVIACTANVRALGVVQVNAHAGDVVEVVTAGIVTIESSGALATIGTAVVSNASGQIVAAGATGDQNIVGYTMSIGAGGAGELVTVLLFPATKYANTAGNAVDCTLTVGAEVPAPTHSIKVSGVFKDYLGNAVTEAVVFLAYLSDDALGQVLSTLVPTADAVVVTDGNILKVHTANIMYSVISEANGQFDLTWAKTNGVDTAYLNVVMPDGRMKHSGAITFSA